jgi:hypothetical protein
MKRKNKNRQMRKMMGRNSTITNYLVTVSPEI